MKPAYFTAFPWKEFCVLSPTALIGAVTVVRKVADRLAADGALPAPTGARRATMRATP